MAQKKRASNKGPASRQTRTPAGCLFWLVLLAVAVAVAVAAREPIKTAFVRYFGKKTESAREGGGAPPAAPSAPAATPAAPPADAPATAVPERQSSGNVRREPSADVFREPSADVRREPSADVFREPSAGVKPALRRARLHFIAIGPDGTTSTVAVDRDLPQSDSPLRDAILALLAGPDTREKGQGLASMIPAETRLRSATVKSRTAYLDFTESFRFTAGGLEGLAAEIRQVVRTATEFPTVDKVQILIEGEKVRYLGTEGVRIDEPLTPASVAQ
jgi:germination protein M